MPTKTLPLSTLIGGVNRATAREKQPAGTVFDALNVLPFDRSGRLRVGQRAGTATLLSGVSSSSVNGLLQVTLGQDETGGAADGPESFSQTFNAGGNAAIGSDWSQYHDGANLFLTPDAVTADLKQVTGPPAILEVDAGAVATRSGAVLTDSIDFATTASDYTIEAVVRVPTVVANDQSIVCRWRSDGADDGSFVNLRLRLNRLFLEYVDVGSAATIVSTFVISPSLTALSQHTIKLVVSGNSFTGYLDGVSRVSGTITAVPATQTGVGLFQVSAAAGAGYVSWAYTNDGPSSPPTNPRTIKLVAAADGSIYWGTTASLSLVASGFASRRPCLTDISSYVIYVNGTQTKKLIASTGVVSDLTATAGEVPTLCRGCRTWRGRLVLFGQSADPQNFFMSRSGDPFDFDYSQEDPAAAFAGNASEAGRVGDLINDMIPWTADKMVIGCDHSLWLIDGDPTDGGAIVNISNGLGLLGREAWCIAPDGTLYFAGSNGLYRLMPGSTTPEPISQDKYPQFFSALNRGSQYYAMAWDRDRHGCYLFVSSIASGTSTHLWYDQRTDGLWPIQYPDNHGPMSALVYDGDGASDRVLMLGGRDGKIRTVQTTGRTDDGTAISAYIVGGPYQPFPDAAVLTGTTIDFGDLAAADAATTRWDATVTLRGGVNVYDVTEGTPGSTAVIAAGDIDRRSKTFRQRIRGGWFAVKIANTVSGDYFAIEDGVLEFEPAGKLRERR